MSDLILETEIVEQIKHYFIHGMTQRRICDKFSLDIKILNNLIIQNEWSIKKIPFTGTEMPLIMSLYKEGVSAKVLGNIFSIDKRKIKKLAEQSGIYRDKFEANRFYQVNVNAFSLPFTPEKAYWLGFLYADAYNYERKNKDGDKKGKGGRISLNLKSTDDNHIKKFINFMGMDKDNFEYGEVNDEKTNKIYKTVGILINSVQLSKNLKVLGCMQAKSLILKYPKWLDPSLNFHFIRGIWDGDGSLKHRNESEERGWNFCGTKEMCIAIHDIFSKEGIEINYYHHSKDPNKNTWCLDTNGNMKIRSVCDLIFKDATPDIYLDRKFDRYQLLKEFNEYAHPEIYGLTTFDGHFNIDGNILNTKYIKNLSKEEKTLLIDPIINHCLKIGFIYPDKYNLAKNAYKNLCDDKIDISKTILNNHSKVGNSISKLFCYQFFNTKTQNNLNLVEAFSNKDCLSKTIISKLDLDGERDDDARNFSVCSILDEMKRLRLCATTSLFKPLNAKYIVERYSEPGDTVGDYSCGFGGRLLGTMSCGRKYIGTDPLTTLELEKMAEFLKFDKKNYKLIDIGSEDYRGEENSIDLYWSSPPYYDLEIYSDKLNQAYNKGREYFYNVYWRKTLENVKYMLKKDKWFGVNVSFNEYKMVQIAEEYFGQVIEKIELVSNRPHMLPVKNNSQINKTKKVEYIYMFKNNK